MICSVCSGHLKPLGRLGNRRHYRCSDCGMESSVEIKESEEENAEEDKN